MANAVPFHITAVEFMNPEPVTSRTLSADSATKLDGVTVAMVGVGFVGGAIAICVVELVDALGAGLLTESDPELPFCKSVALRLT